MATAAYGAVEVRRLDDGRLKVTQADEVVGVAVELLAESSPPELYIDSAGNLVIAGQVGYAPIGFAPDGAGAPRILICRRVWGHVEPA